jgi:ABC-type proline/glycine betaine transport system ATPase subunit
MKNLIQPSTRSRLLAVGSEILLMDEPLVNLDPLIKPIS